MAYAQWLVPSKTSGSGNDTVNVTAPEGWSWKFTNLPKYKVGAQGQPVTYTITEA